MILRMKQVLDIVYRLVVPALVIALVLLFLGQAGSLSRRGRWRSLQGTRDLSPGRDV
jgi:hypothetical protein